MFKRTRDVKRNIRPLQKISFEEWEKVQEKYIKAKAFINDKNDIYLMHRQRIFEAENEILSGVRETREENTNNIIRKIFITPKEVRTDELVGGIKTLSSILIEVQSWIDNKEDLEKKEADGLIIIERNKEKGK